MKAFNELLIIQEENLKIELNLHMNSNNHTYPIVQNNIKIDDILNDNVIPITINKKIKNIKLGK